MEFEYIRHGTTSLIGFFDVATGRMEMPYLNSTRTEEDFVEAVKALAGTDPQAPWTFICDGLNTHKSEALVRYVAEACAPGMELGKKGKTGILKSMESRADFLHDPSHRLRFVYTPKHSSWMNQIEIWFGIINRRIKGGTSGGNQSWPLSVIIADCMICGKSFYAFSNHNLAIPPLPGLV